MTWFGYPTIYQSIFGPKRSVESSHGRNINLKSYNHEKIKAIEKCTKKIQNEETQTLAPPREK